MVGNEVGCEVTGELVVGVAVVGANVVGVGAVGCVVGLSVFLKIVPADGASGFCWVRTIAGTRTKARIDVMTRIAATLCHI